eukprot:GHVP01021761.1.p1 GENE.GHVP01021761.1~~GHVP01021761.1.p1  ORF type:complete len:750 (+),score=147.36 GHVP01021761.1:30-2252(+)
MDSVQHSVSGVSDPFKMEVHARGCRRGELFLTEEEAEFLKTMLSPTDFKFVNSDEILRSDYQRKRGVQSSIQSSKNSGKGARFTKNRSDDEFESSTKFRSSTSKKESRKKSSNQGNSSKSEESSAESDESMAEPPSRKRISSSQAPFYSLPLRSSRRNRETLTGTWQSACQTVLRLMEDYPNAQWFRQPVDPDAEGIPDYFEAVPNPMDLHTVKQKLDLGMYSHPYRWQHDVRAIFANAFRYHGEDSQVWHDAEVSAQYFEQLCKEHEGVNPYAVFAPEEEPEPPTSSNSITDNLEDATAFLSTAMENETVTLKAPQFLHILSQFVSKSQATGPSLLDGLAAQSSSEIPEVASPFVHYPATLHTSTQLPTPTLPPPCEPPVASVASRTFDKPMNQIQKRTFYQKFRDLDIHYRNALLEIVKIELGINTVLSALDDRFSPDLELLPTQKQKQVILYLQTLAEAQKRHLDNGFRAVVSSTATQPNIKGENAEPQKPPIDKGSAAGHSTPSVVSSASSGVSDGNISSLSEKIAQPIIGPSSQQISQPMPAGFHVPTEQPTMAPGFASRPSHLTHHYANPKVRAAMGRSPLAASPVNMFPRGSNVPGIAARGGPGSPPRSVVHAPVAFGSPHRPLGIDKRNSVPPGVGCGYSSSSSSSEVADEEESDESSDELDYENERNFQRNDSGGNNQGSVVSSNLSSDMFPSYERRDEDSSDGGASSMTEGASVIFQHHLLHGLSLVCLN